MADRLPFIFGVHAHQPVGNFSHVIDQAYEGCYRPFLEVLLRSPSVKSTWHLSGPLVDFLEARYPEYLQALRSLVVEGRVELLASGYQEPILASLSRIDRREQVGRYLDRLESLFDVRPMGLWLTERVWEPELIEDLVACGIQYVFVDDYHLLSAGFAPEQLHGYFLTESGGSKLGVFPIDERLRYLIPFREEDETLEYAETLMAGRDLPAAIIIDDLEKFGSWPGTNDLVYRRGWLARFFEKVSSQSSMAWTLPREYVVAAPPRGLAYLPTASYFEMGEWSLPPDRAREFARLIEEWKRTPGWNSVKPYLRGSIWKNFLVKYPEANYLHKKMMHVSAKVNALPDPVRREAARAALYRGQCNDAFWHGVFGGLYLPHLRRANYRNLLEAEALAEETRPTVLHEDLDMDGSPEVYASGRDWVLCIAPRKGGGLRELSARGLLHNFCDTLSRRREHYHPLGEAVAKTESRADGEAGGDSIHDLQKAIPAKVRSRMAYDAYERLSFLDHFLPAGTTLKAYRLARHRELADTVVSEYALDRLVEDRALLSRSLRLENGLTLTIRKEYRWNLGPGRFEVQYEIVGEGTLDEPIIFAPEMTFSFPSADSEPGSIRKQGEVLGGFGEDLEVEGGELIFRDEVGGFELTILASGAERFWVYPVMTLSQSEGGFDEIYQGSSITPLFRLSPSSFEFRCAIVLHLQQLTS
ncbi:MAG: DUF1926 domain-containing protein [Acidobacteria bacterium]|nr:DUF1926 domain-containing protein [Acidobacteriota bacterium]